MADNVVSLDVARLQGRDQAKLKEVVRLLEELRIADGKPLTLLRGEERWILLFGRIVEDSHG